MFELYSSVQDGFGEGVPLDTEDSQTLPKSHNRRYMFLESQKHVFWNLRSMFFGTSETCFDCNLNRPHEIDSGMTCAPHSLTKQSAPPAIVGRSGPHAICSPPKPTTRQRQRWFRGVRQRRLRRGRSRGLRIHLRVQWPRRTRLRRRPYRLHRQ